MLTRSEGKAVGGLQCAASYRHYYYVTYGWYKGRYWKRVESRKCKSCINIPHHWTGPLVCNCGNPYINPCLDSGHYNRARTARAHNLRGRENE